ncbi:MAG: DUF4091 domain-containing protein [Clostridia bacterium]|nr:DUF4091 domain-containing protein [Clostridia bacterium]
MTNFRIRPLTSLAKVFPDEYPSYMESTSLTTLKNEDCAFQVAFSGEYDNSRIQAFHDGSRAHAYRIEVESDLECVPYIVETTPSDLPAYPDHDPYILRDTPGLYPDLLRPITSESDIFTPVGQWRSVWVSLPGMKTPGRHRVTVRFWRTTGLLVGEVTVTVDIVDAELPRQELLHTSWFHTDCLCNWYRMEPMSEEYWRITENFARSAREHGVNLLLTPLFTPPLDTLEGRERRTVQLVDVTVTKGEYSFGFEKLTRWIEMCCRVGIEYFEMPHFFTQWGAKHAPKIMAWADGEYRRIFGWETDSVGEEYYAFLKAFAAALIPYLERMGISDKCILHVSDEPGMPDYGRYSRCAAIVRELFPGFRVIDALSELEFYETGLIECPVPKTPAVEKFIAAGVPRAWGYYCCSQYKLVSNRLFCMPMARTRILGMQMYKFDLEGFLQWGFNFWNSCGSVRPIDPFRISDLGCISPSGDAYVVYPGEDGEPLLSLRLKAFNEGLNDLRALRLLESLIGREKTLRLLEKGLDKPLTFTEYPRTEEWLLNKREEINRAIRRALTSKA